jgi:hypothetical protein
LIRRGFEQKQERQMAKTPKSAPADQAEKQAEQAYPRTLTATNNTPIPIYLSEAGVCLAANYHKPANAAVVTYQSADHFNREMANIEAIASVHGFSDPLIFSDPAEPESSGEEATN